MAPALGGIVEPDSISATESLDGDEGEQAGAPWMRALQELYGGRGEDEAMPLAIPYGAFALPHEEAPSLPAWMLNELGPSSEAQRPATTERVGTMSTMSMPTPSVPISGSSQGAGQYSRSTPSYSSGSSWSESSSFDSSYGDSSAGEADAWAGVIADAVSDAGVAAPALALAGEERGGGGGGGESQSSNEGQKAEEGEKPAGGADVDELAEAVYMILRRRLAVERERDFA
jgi:hypothetical protein